MRVANLVINIKNCGTGAGGFQQGNTCASGGSSASGGSAPITEEIDFFARRKEIDNRKDAFADAVAFNSVFGLLSDDEVATSSNLSQLDQLKQQIGEYKRLDNEDILDYWRGRGYRALAPQYANEDTAIREVAQWFPVEEMTGYHKDPLFTEEAKELVKNVDDIYYEEKKKAYEWSKTPDAVAAIEQARKNEDINGDLDKATQKVIYNRANKNVVERLRPQIAPIYKELQTRAGKLNEFAESSKFKNPIPLYRQVQLDKDTLNNILQSGEVKHQNLSAWTTKPALRTINGNVLLRIKDATSGLVITDNYQQSGESPLLENEIIRPKGKLRIVGVRRYKTPTDSFERSMFSSADKVLIDLEEVPTAKKSMKQKNCGTGAGGFQQGNTCASGTGSGSQTASGQAVTSEEITGWFPTDVYTQGDVLNRNSPLALLDQSEIDRLHEISSKAGELDYLVEPNEVQDFWAKASPKDKKDLESYIKSGYKYINANPKTDQELWALYKSWEQYTDNEIADHGFDPNKVTPLQNTLYDSWVKAKDEAYKYLYDPQTKQLREDRVQEYRQTANWKKEEAFIKNSYAERGIDWSKAEQSDDVKNLLKFSMEEYHTQRIAGEKSRAALQEIHQLWVDRRNRIDARLRNRKLSQPTTLYRMMKLEPAQIEAIRTQGELTHRSVNSWTPQPLKVETMQQANVVLRIKNATEGMPLLNNWGKSGLKEHEVLRPSGTLKVTGIKRATATRPESMTEAEWAKYMSNKLGEVFLVDVEESTERKKSLLSWKNCGTGAGGFQEGNTCASGDGSGEQTTTSALESTTTTLADVAEQNKFAMESRRTSDGRKIPFYVANNDAFDTTAFFEQADAGRTAEDFYNNNPVTNERTKLLDWVSTAEKTGVANYQDDSRFTRMQEVEAGFAIWGSNLYDVVNGDITLQESAQRNKMLYTSHAYLFDRFNGTSDSKGDIKTHQDVVVPKLREQINRIASESKLKGDGVIFRGMRLSEDAVNNIISEGELKHTKLNSWTTDSNIARNFTVDSTEGAQQNNKKVVVRLAKPKVGMPSLPSGENAEAEVLRPASNLKVERVIKFDKRTSADDPDYLIEVSEDSRFTKSRKTPSVVKNCGTGAGGFQEGNTCASGSGGGASANARNTPTTINTERAKKYVADSALKEIGWHWTSQQNTTAIAEEGFKIPNKPTFSSVRVFGEGVYFGLGEQDVYSDLVREQPYERLQVVADIRNPITIENARSEDSLIFSDGAEKAIRLAGGTQQDINEINNLVEASLQEGRAWREKYRPAYQTEVVGKLSERAKKIESLSQSLSEEEVWEKINNNKPTYDVVLTRVKTALRDKYNATDEDIEALDERKLLTDALLKKMPMPRFLDRPEAARGFHTTEKLKQLGVDAIIVKQNQADRAVGGSQVVVFDPKRVKVVRDE
jgi:hypothetical protein